MNDKLENEAFESLIASDLSAKMKHWGNGPTQPENPRGGNWLKLLALLLVGGAIWWFWPSRQPAPPPPPVMPPPTKEVVPVQESAPMAQKITPPEKPKYLALATAYYVKPTFSHQVRGEETEEEHMIHEAQMAFSENDYQATLVLAEKAPAAYASDADYIQAHALFNLKKYTQAANLFEKLKISVRYGEAAEWYFILSLLPNYDQNKSLINKDLVRISNDGTHTYNRQAAALRNQLK
ncbi:MAG: hypothetical protein JNJ57_15160 [Saprospiraceae bacterium]|nr:hypothetical protein [Saprospiraceae bacterium]